MTRREDDDPLDMRPPALVFVCRNEDMHPYNCDGPGACIHCDRGRTDDHDPRTCRLCDLDGWPTEL